MMISFVIPMYNASSTIFRCLDSIYGLPVDEKDFEVIVIDDCSTDNTVEININGGVSVDAIFEKE